MVRSVARSSRLRCSVPPDPAARRASGGHTPARIGVPRLFSPVNRSPDVVTKPYFHQHVCPAGHEALQAVYHVSCRDNTAHETGYFHPRGPRAPARPADMKIASHSASEGVDFQASRPPSSPALRKSVWLHSRLIEGRLFRDRSGRTQIAPLVGTRSARQGDASPYAVALAARSGLPTPSGAVVLPPRRPVGRTDAGPPHDRACRPGPCRIEEDDRRAWCR